VKFKNFGVPPLPFFYLSKKAEIGNGLTAGMGIVMLPVILRIDKCT
jgi:hypothetical protein